MRRATLLLASGLAAAAVAGAFLYDRDSPRSVGVATEPAPATRAPPASPPATEPNVPAREPPSAEAAQYTRSAELEAYEHAVRSRGPPPDEATVLADLRNGAMRDLQQSYSLMLDELGLTLQERQDLLAVLVELQVESAWSNWQNGAFQKRGRTIGAQERHERIAAAIGDEKLDELLLFEANADAYWEAQQITSLLRRRNVPITTAQRDELFKIVVDVRDRYPYLAPDVDSASTEYVEQQLAQLADFDRHIVELAPSVLSATQVAHLSDEYQWMARQRIDLVELQKTRRAERPGAGAGWVLPARWNPH